MPELESRPLIKITKTEKLVSTALLASLALISGLLESRFPLPFPGMRLGLANVFILAALVLLGARRALAVASLKIALGFLFTGNVFALSCSVAGTVLSLPLSVALFLFCRRSVSLPAISVASAAAFNIGQVAAVAALLSEPAVFGYLPLLLPVGCLTGFAVGVIAVKLSERMISYMAASGVEGALDDDDIIISGRNSRKT